MFLLCSYFNKNLQRFYQKWNISDELKFADISLEVTVVIVEFHKVVRNFCEGFHEVILVVVVVLFEVGILYLLVPNDLLHSKSLHEVVKQFPQGLCEVVLDCRYWSDVLNSYSIFDILIILMYILYLIHFYMSFHFKGYFCKGEL